VVYQFRRFKNRTDGNVEVALDAVISAKYPHRFMGTTKEGISAIVATKGNKNCHIILRGGNISGPNYHAEQISEYINLMRKKVLIVRLLLIVLMEIL